MLYSRIVFTRIQLSLLFYEYWNFDLTIICFPQNKIRPTCHQKLCCGLETFPSFYTLGKNTLKTVIYILLEFFAQKVKIEQNWKLDKTENRIKLKIRQNWTNWTNWKIEQNWKLDKIEKLAKLKKWTKLKVG